MKGNERETESAYLLAANDRQPSSTSSGNGSSNAFATTADQYGKQRRCKKPAHERIQGSSPASIVNRATTSVSLKPYFVQNKSINKSMGVTLCFSDVTVLHRTIFEFYKKPQVVVHNAVGVFAAGKLHCVSGLHALHCNKLLGCLAGSVSPASGSVQANNIPVQSAAFRTIVGFVGRIRNVTIDAFTAQTNVLFALRMRSCSPLDAMNKAVTDALAIVDLDPFLFVSELDVMGKLKLHIAMELVTDPPALFVENPLDRLDCHQHAEISELLARVAGELHKTVVVSTTSLPLALYEKIDSIVFIGSGGHVVYSGKREIMPQYFSWLRLPIHALDSPSAGRQPSTYTRFSAFPLRQISVTLGGGSGDHFEGDGEEVLIVDSGEQALDLLKLWEDKDNAQRGTASGRHPHTMQIAAKFFDSEYRAKLMEEQEESLLSPTTGGGASTQRFSPMATTSGVSPSTLSTPFQLSQHHEHPSILTKTWLLLRYKLEQSVRQKDFYIAFISLFLALAFSMWVANKQKLNQQGMMNVRGIIFFLFSVILELNIMLLPSLFEDIQAFPHQRDGGYYNALTALVVFVTRAIIARFVFIATVAIFIYFVLTGMNDLLVLLGVASFAHACLIYVIALMTTTLRWATFVSYCFEAYFIIFSGFLINMRSLPSAVAKTSIIRYGYGAAVAELMRGRNFTCDAPYGGVNVTRPTWETNVSSYCYTGDAYVDLQGFEHDNTDHNSWELVGMASLLLFIALARLHFVNR